MNTFLKLIIPALFFLISCSSGNKTQNANNQEVTTNTNNDIEEIIESELIAEDIDSLSSEIDALLDEIEN